MNRTVVCAVEGLDPPVLTRWRLYEVLAEGTASEPVIRVRADDGSEQWFPACLFSPHPAASPRLVRWRFDEPVADPGCAFVEISLDLSDGSRRWCNVVTLGWLQRRLADHQQSPGIYLGQTLVLPTLALEYVEAALRDLERSKRLTSATNPLPPEDGPKG